MTFINIVFIAIYCKMVGHMTNIYCPTVGHLIENLLKQLNIPPMPTLWDLTLIGINYYADLRMTFRQNFFLQDWFRNKFAVGLG
jgi:hypothetical protein